MKILMTTFVSLVMATALQAAPATPPAPAAEIVDKGPMLQLANGAQVSKLEVIGVMVIMRGMSARSPEAFQDVVKKAYQPKMELKKDFIQRLVKMGIANEDGTLAPHVQDIITAYWTIDKSGAVQFITPKGSNPSDINMQ